VFETFESWDECPWRWGSLRSRDVVSGLPALP
jgi:hypothetical protein